LVGQIYGRVGAVGRTLRFAPRVEERKTEWGKNTSQQTNREKNLPLFLTFWLGVCFRGGDKVRGNKRGGEKKQTKGEGVYRDLGKKKRRIRIKNFCLEKQSSSKNGPTSWKMGGNEGSLGGARRKKKRSKKCTLVDKIFWTWKWRSWPGGEGLSEKNQRF